MKRLLFISVLIIILAQLVISAPGGVFVDTCYSESHSDLGDLSLDLSIVNSCENNNSITWDSVNLTTLGDVVDGDVIIGDSWMYVDSSLRPDLDSSATLFFNGNNFVIEPVVYEDGVVCSSCNITVVDTGLYVDVSGFSNYSLSARQEFTVYSDDNPELKKKVYQTVDLGDARRSSVYSCIVQIFGKNADDDWVLVQTNPERAVQGKLFGSPDVNQPESLGYFPTVNGVVNTYFRNDNLYGYMNFNLVVQCTSNSSSMLVYEEPIVTTYSPSGRLMTSRGLWLTDGDNAYYFTFGAFLLLFAFWMLFMFYNRGILR